MQRICMSGRAGDDRRSVYRNMTEEAERWKWRDARIRTATSIDRALRLDVCMATAASLVTKHDL